MATYKVPTVEPPDEDKSQQAVRANGLITPDATPEPDAGRIAHDEARRAAAEAAENKPPPARVDPRRRSRSPGQRSRERERSKSPRNSSRRDDAAANAGQDAQPQGKDSDSDPDSDDDNDKGEPPSDEQANAVKSVLSSGKKCRKILQVQDHSAYATENEEKESIMNAFRKLGTLTHPVKNSHKDAREAFDKVVNAARKLGVDEDELDEMQIWKGDEEFLELKINDHGMWEPKVAAPDDNMDGVGQLEREPGMEHQRIYAEATPHMLRLQMDANDANAIKELDSLNSEIEKQNEKYGYPTEERKNFFINYETFVANYKLAYAPMLRLQDNPMDVESRTVFDKINTTLKLFSKQKHYPQGWVLIPPPNGYQIRIYQEATPYIARIIRNVEDTDALAELAKINERIVQYNRERKLDEDQCKNGVIDGDQILPILKSAAPFIGRLTNNSADVEAKRSFDMLNEQLRRLNIFYHYPSDWVMKIPSTKAQEQSTSPEPKGKDKAKELDTTTQGEASTSPQSRPSGAPKARKSTQKAGWVSDRGTLWVSDRGTLKEIRGFRKKGWGHQLLLHQPGKNGYDIYELVAASTFGRGCLKSYQAMDGAINLDMTRGSKKDLEGKMIEDLNFFGVAPVRRDPKKEPMGGWSREPETIALISFDDNPTKYRWYHRSDLIQEIGPVADYELDDYRNDAGQEIPPHPTRHAKRQFKGRVYPKVASDDAAEGSQPLGDQDTEYADTDAELEHDQAQGDPWEQKKKSQTVWAKRMANETVFERFERLKTEVAMLAEQIANEAQKTAKKRG